AEVSASMLSQIETGKAFPSVRSLYSIAAALSLSVDYFFPAAGNGAAFGLLPIGWIVLMAIFLYNLTVATGQFEIVKHSVAALSSDRRIQALLIAFSFGAFVEGAAGFGTPVAISAALLMGTGFKPLYAAGLALLANTSPVAFGALGTPIITLGQVTGLDIIQLSAMAGRQLPIFSLIVPVWLVWVMAGWRGVVGVWPALLVCGGSFAIVQFALANYHGPWLVDVAGGLVSLVSLALFLRVWQPAEVWHFPDEPPPAPQANFPHPSRWQIASAWVPWGLLSVFVFLWGLPPVKTALGAPDRTLKKAFADRPETIAIQATVVMIKVPALHGRIARDQPVVRQREAETAIYDLNWLSATGTGIFCAAVLSAAWLRIAPRRFLVLFAKTCRAMRWPLLTIACMLAIAYTTRYSGMDATLGLAFTRTGWLYPLFAALLGWLGVALTGSDTSSNALFGSLQTITAGQLVDAGIVPLTDVQAKVLFAAANSTGGVMGKMIDAQSIVVAAVATGQHNQEGPILRFVFVHSLVLALLMGLWVLAQAYWLGWMIP
ncbi:MAG: lactate permease LctP family transporter, partial [Gemmataceae bacterium]|nr:lactate permease LctP family transporter [Gemmataceae bacterium]